MSSHPADFSLQRVVELLREAVPGLLAIYRFGSAGTKYERPDSDMDLAFLADRARDAVVTWNIAQDIAAELGRDVDLVDLRNASTVMAANIVTGGTRLLSLDAGKCAEFEAHTLADYARLNEERRGILQDIEQRGSIQFDHA